ncbi:FAS1-like dehydratase domain-containing protein [Oceanobacillus halophilus]|uniref:MaoC family dehydratase n=1 Tax=Oceanobacillus halophilus TaxID=930130 RepID=A0A495A8L8_9BACI|nr:MaoC family dehydratase N-terminal domain-containing protein [Oceanobacillus halophilus]RKQ35904.1 MaoC family dehydratase [Oceanobacillus halophilus]
MYKKFIGKTSNPVLNTLERGAIKKFAESIGDKNPLFIDEEFGNSSSFNENIVPPTYTQTLDYGEIEGLIVPSKGLIHGEQIFEYSRPLKVGEKIKCYTIVENFYEKEGRNGTLSFLSRNKIGEDLEDNHLFKITEVLIITEAVRKVMEV